MDLKFVYCCVSTTFRQHFGLLTKKAAICGSNFMVAFPFQGCFTFKTNTSDIYILLSAKSLENTSQITQGKLRI